jgi:omega-6 fatty acid desaturase (delta-12 desaturase)
LGGLLYFIIPPRLTWLRASIGLVRHVIAKKIACPGTSIRSHLRDFEAPYCCSVQAYGHMLANNVTLLTLWALMAWSVGPVLFFACYIVSMSLSGAASIVLFAVQHNFEHSYASQNEGWDRDTAAIAGTSFLVLPRWLNWFTANMAYHHVHHLCASVPNYGPVACHNEYQHVFSGVTRVRLSQVPHSLRYILWDTGLRAPGIRCGVSATVRQRHPASAGVQSSRHPHNPVLLCNSNAGCEAEGAQTSERNP